MKKQALVTGASKGIGYALVNELLSKGYSIIGTCRSGDIMDFENKDFKSISLDLSKPNSIKDFVQQINSEEIRIDLLINNAGIGPDLDFELPELNTFESTFEVNVKGTVLLTEQLLSSIVKGGRILNISSKMGSINYCEKFDSVAYRMSKSALNMYTKILSNRIKDRISVAAIHPGWVKTTITKSNIDGRLTPAESSSRILRYLENEFENGDFWDAERNVKLKW